MKRKEFLKKLGLGMIGAVVGAKVATELAKEQPEKMWWFDKQVQVADNYFNVQRIKDRQEFLREYPYTEEEAFLIHHPMVQIDDVSDEDFEESLRNIKNGPQRVVTNAPVEWTPLNKYHGRRNS